MRADDLLKYPRTRHLEGSGLQRGDHDLNTVPFSDLRGRTLVIEEKVDGANVGLSFGPGREVRLQCRGHYLTGGPGEEQFQLLKPWAETHRTWLYDALGTRYLLFGEWLYAKHTVFYDALPHFLMEFDVYDRDAGVFLSTDRRRALWDGTPLVSVPVLRTGVAPRTAGELEKLVAPSLYKTAEWRESLRVAAVTAGADPERTLHRETDGSDLAEGLYIKWEEDGAVRGRYKWVRPDFISAILDSGSHWRDRRLVRNALRPDVDLFAL